MGYCAAPTLTTLGVLREPGTDEDQQDEGLGILRGRGKMGRALARKAAMQDPRRSRALKFSGRITTPSGTTYRRRPNGTAARRRARTGQRRGALTRDLGRALERSRAMAAEKRAAEALAIAEAERLARETITPPTRPPGNGYQPPPPGPRSPCGPVPDRRRGWSCVNGRWEYRMPGGGVGPQPVLPSPTERDGEIRNGALAPMIETVRPWWMGRAPVGEIPMRDTSGIPTPPGLPGGPGMRPPASRDTATERVAAPAAGMDMAKMVPLALAGAAALMFMRR